MAFLLRADCLPAILAVVEVATFADLLEQQLALLHDVAAMAAMKLEVLQRNLRTKELLAFQRALLLWKIRTYKPYPWQKEFHAAGANNPVHPVMTSAG